MHIFESVLRLFFDLLHGIKRMDVPLMMVLEFTILLGYDGQLEQSDMEKELFNSAIDQLKERSYTIFFAVLFETGFLFILSIYAVRP